MAVDFSKHLKVPAGQAKKPEALPPGDYQGVIKSHELGDNNKNKTPYVRFQIGLTGWPDEVPDEDRIVDLSKRQLRRDYFFTDDALWRLDELIRSCGIEPAGRTYEEIIPELHGASVVVEVQQYMNQTNSEIGNQIGKLAGAS